MKLVIIDDEIVICQGLAKMIESNDWGWSVAGTFVDPEDALETCEHQIILLRRSVIFYSADNCRNPFPI